MRRHDQREPLGQATERSKYLERGPAAKTLFDATYTAIIKSPEVAEALFKDRLTKKAGRRFGLRDDKTLDHKLEATIGNAKWEISGTIGVPTPEAEQTLVLRKLSTEMPSAYLDGYSVTFFTGHKTTSNDPDVYLGNIVYVSADGTKPDDFQITLEKAEQLLNEFSPPEPAVNPVPIRGKFREWRARRKPTTSQE